MDWIINKTTGARPVPQRRIVKPALRYLYRKWCVYDKYAFIVAMVDDREMALSLLGDVVQKRKI